MPNPEQTRVSNAHPGHRKLISWRDKLAIEIGARSELRNFRENNHPVREGFVDHIVGFTDILAKPALAEEWLIIWKSLKSVFLM